MIQLVPFSSALNIRVLFGHFEFYVSWFYHALGPITLIWQRKKAII